MPIPDAGPPDVVIDTSPILLYSDAGSFPYGIAVDDAWVYFTSSVAWTLSRFPKAGGTPVILASNMTNAGRVALDQSAAYVVVRGTADSYVDGAIERVAKDGSSTQILASNLHGAYGLTLDGDELYVACSGSVINGSYQGDGSIIRVKTDGSSAPEVLLTNEDFPAMVVVDGANVYFTDEYSGTVTRCAKASCAATRTDLFTQLDEPNGLALTPTGLVFAEYHGGRVLSGNIDGTGLTTLQPSRGLPHDVAVVAGASAPDPATGDVYWLESLTLEVNRQVLEATIHFTTLAKTTQNPNVIALDDTFAYVTDEHAGTITRVGR